MDPYNPNIRELFLNTSHAGDANGGVIGYFDDQGIRITLSAIVAAGDITSMRFRAWGCPHVIAAAEAVCRHYEGRPSEDLEEFSTDQIMQDLAIPVEKTGRILVLEDAVRSLGQAIRDDAL